MLRKIVLVNFKCFPVLDLPCAPLNLLCGLNGMGKSSVIQALLVLRQSFKSKELDADHLVLGGDLIDLGAGPDVLFEGAEDEVIQFILIDERMMWCKAFESSRTSGRLTAVAVDSERAEKGRLLEISDGSTFEKWGDVPPFGGDFRYVQAERVGPRKSYPLSAVARHDNLKSRNAYTWNYLNHYLDRKLLADDPRCADAPGRRLVDVVDHWLQDVSPGAHLQLEPVPAADAVLASFTFDRPGDVQSRRHRATNVGFGLSYVLPVVLALLAPRGALCLIENPEAHLHPRGQTRLAELAVRAAQAGVQVFVETHSDHFVDGVRIAVRDGLIAPADAAIHYFERRDGHVVVESPEIDADGRLSHWPAGFFDQHDENLLRLLAP